MLHFALMQDMARRGKSALDNFRRSDYRVTGIRGPHLAR